MIELLVKDFKGEKTRVLMIAKYRTDKSTGLVEMRAGFIFPCGDAYMVWLPVFTDWWPTC